VLPALARLVDDAVAEAPGHVLIHVEGPIAPDVRLAVRRLDPDVHPFEALAGFRAPRTWSAFGIRARGRAHHLEGSAGEPPAQVAATFLVDRDGREASLLRAAGAARSVAGPAAGTIPDVARRVLGLPTEAAPRSTAPLWTALWLHRVLQHDDLCSWPRLAGLHPALSADPEGPADLVTAARSHARATPWSAARSATPPVPLPGGPLPRRVAAWMDDGFFARWSLGAFPPLAELARDAAAQLAPPLRAHVLAVALALLEEP
jgi:hypothetical protein